VHGFDELPGECQMIHPMIALLAVILILSTGFLILYKIFGLVEKDMADDEKKRDDNDTL
jgi:hypothetical protein